MVPTLAEVPWALESQVRVKKTVLEKKSAFRDLLLGFWEFCCFIYNAKVRVLYSISSNENFPFFFTSAAVPFEFFFLKNFRPLILGDFC